MYEIRLGMSSNKGSGGVAAGFEEMANQIKRLGCREIPWTDGQAGVIGALMRRLGKKRFPDVVQGALGHRQTDLTSYEAGKIISHLRKLAATKGA